MVQLKKGSFPSVFKILYHPDVYVQVSKSQCQNILLKFTFIVLSPFLLSIRDGNFFLLMLQHKYSKETLPSKFDPRAAPKTTLCLKTDDIINKS